MSKDVFFDSNNSSNGQKEPVFEKKALPPEGANTLTDIVKCPSCGSTMTFSPDEQQLKCRHCGTVETFAKDSRVQELELSAALSKAESWDGETKIYGCENCGARVVLENNAVSSNCPFCGTSHVLMTNEIAGIKPNALIPFTLGAENASQKCRAWSKKRIFAPKSFKKSFKAQDIKGVYTPCFTFDSRTISVYNGRVGQRRTRVVGSGKNRRTETYIHWYSISGTTGHFYDDVLIAAGSKISQRQMDKLSPFAREKSAVYSKSFLHGFMANQYSKNIQVSWGEAKDVMDADIRRRILRQHGADTVDYLNISTNHHDVTYKYMLMPVYVGNYSFRKKVYNIYVNGSTGKVYGKAPVSPFKVALLILIILLIAAAGSFFISSDGQSAKTSPPVYLRSQTVKSV